MNTNAKIAQVAQRLGIACAPDIYSGSEKTYMTFNIYDERIEMSADDEVEEVSRGVYVHLFMPKTSNFYTLKSRLQQEMTDMDFSYPELINNTIEEDNIRHLTFECTDDESED